MNDGAEGLNFSVVIATWNRRDLLGGCLDSVLAQDLDPSRFEVVVVDDGSTDGTADAVSRRTLPAAPDVRVVTITHSGLNAARNAGVDESRGAVICFVDDDELLPIGYLTKLDALYRAAPEIDGIGGPYHAAGSDIRTCATCEIDEADLPGDGTREVTELLGGNMSIRAELFEEVGTFDDSLSGRGDESEWFVRASARRFLYDPDVFVFHRRSARGVMPLLKTAYLQGRARPVFEERRGARFVPHPSMFLSLVGHAVRRRCWNGLVLAMRELGATEAWAKGQVRTSLQRAHENRARADHGGTRDAR